MISAPLLSMWLASPPVPSPAIKVEAYEVVASKCPDGKKHTGTGIVVSNWYDCQGGTCPDRLLLTSLHVVHGCSEVTVQPQFCNRDDVPPARLDALVQRMSWTPPADQAVAAWPEYDLAAFPLPRDALKEAKVAKLDFQVTPRPRDELELRARRDHGGCPSTEAEVVDTRGIVPFVVHMYQVKTINSYKELVGATVSTHRQRVSGVRVILHRGGGSVPGASGGALLDPARDRVIGIHQAGFEPSTRSALDGWAIQIPAQEQLGSYSCLVPEAEERCARLDQPTTWPAALYKSEVLEGLAEKDWVPPPLKRKGSVLGVELGWQPIYNTRLQRLMVENIAAKLGLFFELGVLDKRAVHSMGLVTAFSYRSGEHQIDYVAPTGLVVDSSAHRLHAIFLELGPQFRLWRHGRVGLNLALGGRVGLEIPSSAGRREYLETKGKLAPLGRLQLRFYAGPRLSLVFSLDYISEFFGNPSIYAFEGVFPNTQVTPLASNSPLSGHAFGISLGLEGTLLYKGK
jgi:hypothetical protein